MCPRIPPRDYGQHVSLMEASKLGLSSVPAEPRRSRSSPRRPSVLSTAGHGTSWANTSGCLASYAPGNIGSKPWPHPERTDTDGHQLPELGVDPSATP